MGLKGYRVWVMGQLDSTAEPHLALQVAFERQTLKPVFHLIGDRLWV
jgi:hypothetical protein